MYINLMAAETLLLLILIIEITIDDKKPNYKLLLIIYELKYD